MKDSNLHGIVTLHKVLKEQIGDKMYKDAAEYLINTLEADVNKALVIAAYDNDKSTVDLFYQ
jgi:hypothetical protein